MPATRPTVASCDVCGNPFPVPVQSGPPPLSCSAACFRSRRAAQRRAARAARREAALDAMVHARALDLLARASTPRTTT